MSVMTSTETRWFVSAALPSTYDAAGYSALTWTEVNEVTTIPTYGSVREVVPHNPLKTGVTEKRKGFVNYGSVALEAGFDASDAGQDIMRANANAFTDIAFKIQYQDGSIDYTAGQVFSSTKTAGSANSIVGTTFNVEFNKPIVEV